MPHKPKLNTVDAVVDDIIQEWPTEARFSVVDLDEDELHILKLILGRYIKLRLEEVDDTANQELMADCIAKSGFESLDEADAAGVILLELWEKLKEMHRLRVVK